MKRIAMYLLVFPFLFGCGGLAIKEKIIGNYYFIAVDVGEDCALYYDEGGNVHGEVIGATVFAVGYNADYMVIKQHPKSFGNPLDKTITNYYILPLKSGMDWRSKNDLIGPFTKIIFDEKCKELKIPESLLFTRIIEDLE